jgi:hypothetical protein
VSGAQYEQPLTLEALATAPIRQRVHVLPGVAIDTLIHGPNRMYATVTLLSAKKKYAIAVLSNLVPTATVDHPVGEGDFVIAAGANLALTPASPMAPGTARMDCCFVTPGGRTPYDGQLATWTYA